MKEKIIRSMKRTPQVSHYLRLAVGGYIAYLGGTIIWDVLNGKAAEPLQIVLSCVLVICGVIIVGLSMYALLKHLDCDASKTFRDGESDKE